MSTLEKTPITILNELCVQKGEVLIYDDVPHETNPKMFACKVEAFNLVAIGSGRSKKLAKHEACANLIVKLKEQEQFADKLTAAPPIRGPVSHPTNATTTTTTTSDEVVDAVEMLRNICVQREWPLPTFKIQQAYGEPHRPIFTGICELSSIKRTGTASKKSVAKQLAFHAILEIVQNFSQNEEQQQLAIVGKSQSASEPPKFQTYRELVKLGIKPKELLLRDRHKFFCRLPKEDRIEACKILSDQNVTNKEKVDLTCNALKLKYNIIDMDNDTQGRKVFVLDGKHECVLIADTESDLYEDVISHFKNMLNLNVPS